MDNKVNISKTADAVRRLQSGDGKAFEDLYNLTVGSAWFTAVKIVRNEHDAEDILQESYMIVLDKINDVKKPESFISWFNIIVANKAKEQLRKSNKTVFTEDLKVSDEDAASVTERLEDTATDYLPEAESERKDLRDQIMSLIDNLSEEKKTVVLLYYYNELSIKEISQALEVNENTVKSRLFYAKKELAQGVNEIEKKNGKLLGLAPVPLIIWALRQTSVSSGAAFASSTASAGVLTAITAGSTAAGAAGTAGAAIAGGGIAAKIAGFTVTQKVIAAAAAVIITGGAAGTTAAITHKMKAQSPEVTVSETVQSYLDSEETLSEEAEAVTLPAEETAVFAEMSSGENRTITSSMPVSLSVATQGTASKPSTTVKPVNSTKAAASATTSGSTTASTTKNNRRSTTARQTRRGTQTTEPAATVTQSTTREPEATAANATVAPSTTAKATATTTTTTSTTTTTTTTTTETATQKATVNITITQGGINAGSTSVTLNDGDTFTFNDAKSAVAAKGFDTEFAEYSGAALPLTVQGGKTYNLTVDVE